MYSLNWFIKNHKHVFLTPKHSAVGIIAPTGIGKTRGCKKIMTDNPKYFGNTLFILPTNIAKNSVYTQGEKKSEHIFIRTPYQAIKDIISDHSFFQTIVIDEAHFCSREYYTIYHILEKIYKKNPVRIIMMSATMDKKKMKNFFHDFRDVSITNPGSSFKIHVRYTNSPIQSHHHVHFHFISNEVIHVLKKHLDSVSTDSVIRAICFVATHEQCDILSSKIMSEFNIQTFVMHGGLSHEEKQETVLNMNVSSRYVCFATNMLETSVTIPDVNLIIDTGIQCSVQGTRLVVKYCDQFSMIQRAGRTGRTCDGIVYRIMREDLFHHLNIQDCPVHNLDIIVLLLFNLDTDPVYYLEDDALDSIQRFRTLGLLENGDTKPDKKISEFIISSRMEVKTGLILYRYMKHYWNKSVILPIDIMTMIVLSIINMYLSEPVYIIYFGKKNRKNIIDRIIRHFEIQDDPLMTIARIILTVFLSKDPKKMASEYSLNFKTLRAIMKNFHHIYSFMLNKIHGQDTKSWKHMIRPFLFVHNDSDIVVIPKPFIYYCRYILSIDKTTNIICGTDILSDYILTPPSIISFPYRKIKCSRMCITPLVVDEYGDIILWTFPYDYRDDDLSADLYYHIRDWESFFAQKSKNKDMFYDCIEEINKEVAYRPGKWKMLEARDDFESCIFRMDS